MTVMDFLKIFRQSGAPFVRIIDANIKPDPNNPTNGVGVIFGGWVTNIPNLFREWEKYEDCEVLKFYVTHEVSHKNYKELGLIPPYRPDITAEYEISELNQKTYYDIVIDGKKQRRSNMANVVKTEIIELADKELNAAIKKFGLNRSNHESFAVLQEEIDEAYEALEKMKLYSMNAWDKTKRNSPPPELRATYEKVFDAAIELAVEAVQCAAMARKGIISNTEITEDKGGTIT